VTRPDKAPIVDDPDQVVVRDRRRLDPQSGQVRTPPAGGAGDAPPAAPDAGQAPQQPQGDAPDAAPAGGEQAAAPESDRVAELTADLQRVSAEYANYRKRVERDRVAVVEMATAGLLGQLLPILDDIDRAREHGDLTGAFASVGESLEQVTGQLGLERFGEAGEPFDPAVHEALMQAEPDPSASVPTCAAVFQPGYRMSGDGRVLRPARVSVAEPGAADTGPGQSAGADGETGDGSGGAARQDRPRLDDKA
jgi:molecular chaperone GrpE